MKLLFRTGEVNRVNVFCLFENYMKVSVIDLVIHQHLVALITRLRIFIQIHIFINTIKKGEPR